jgi:two-component system OmpR family sensor kinase
MGRFHFGRLRTRIALTVAVSAAAALVLVYALVVPSLARNLERSRIDRLERAAAAQRLLFENYINNTGTPRDLRTTAEAIGGRVSIYLEIQDSPLTLGSFQDSVGGTPLAPSVVHQAVKTGAQQHGIGGFAGHRDALVADPLTVNGKNYAVLYAVPLEDVSSAVRLVRSRELLGVVVGLLLALALGLALAEALARRLRHLQTGVERIASGRFDEPVVDHGADEIGDLARTFDQMRRQLAQLDRSRSEFISNASHELRTPLTSLGGYLELVDEGGLEPEVRDEFLREMRRQVDRLTKLASDLLDLSRLDAGGTAIAREPVDLAAAAADVVHESDPLARRSGMTLDLDHGPSALWALGDELRVRQVVRALVDNALRHTPRGTRVTVAWQLEGERAVIRVWDDGPGIPTGDQEQVFERFWRGPGAAASGSGLGLAIARELASRMGGSLTLRSRPGSTVFVLGLAAAPQPAAPEAAPMRV